MHLHHCIQNFTKSEGRERGRGEKGEGRRGVGDRKMDRDGCVKRDVWRGDGEI